MFAGWLNVVAGGEGGVTAGPHALGERKQTGLAWPAGGLVTLAQHRAQHGHAGAGGTGGQGGRRRGCRRGGGRCCGGRCCGWLYTFQFFKLIREEVTIDSVS